jgi:hypothetical protein
MQALDVLGLNVVHANITTFRGLVLNIFNAEVIALHWINQTLVINLESFTQTKRDYLYQCSSRTDIPYSREIIEKT